MTPIGWVGGITLILAALITVEFAIAYHRKTRGGWRRSEAGQAIMLLDGALAAILVAVSARWVDVNLLGNEDPLWFRWLRLAVFLGIPVAVLRLRLLLAETLPARPEDHRRRDG